MGARNIWLVFICGMALSSSIAFANDASALLEAGGIVLTVSKDVSMESEDLWISRKLVRVSYVFRNAGSGDVKTRVAFPVPPIPSCDENNESECEGDIQLSDLPNPMKFKLTIDGRDTAFQTEIKETQKKNGVGKTFVTHHWEQVFPAGRAVSISHEYVPVAGGFFTDTGGFSKGQFERDMAESYCVGPKLLASLKQKENYLWAVHYILSTGANWKGPIRNFKLTIAKDSPHDKVSVCLPDTKRTSRTTFQVVRKDFVPRQDLKILFVPASE